MASAGVSFHGKTKIRIINIGVKFDSPFYIDKGLKPFIANDVPRMFSGDQNRDMVLHQDSASSHTSKQTLTYMRQQKIKFRKMITSAEWMPKSSDAVPMDFAI